MGQYLYLDVNGHEVTVTHRMLYTSAVICSTCEEMMWKKPQSVAVNWGGLPPSGGELNPDIRGLLDTADERRDAFEQEHEEHETRTDSKDN